MSRGYRLIAILAIVLLARFESGNALKCYTCNDCPTLKDEYLQDCELTTTTTVDPETPTTPTTTPTSPPTSTPTSPPTTTPTTPTTTPTTPTTTPTTTTSSTTSTTTSTSTTTTTTTTTARPTSDESSTDEDENKENPAGGDTGNKNIPETYNRGRRSVIDRISRVFADESPQWKCYKVAGTENGTDVVARGCTIEANFCDDIKDKISKNAKVSECRVCDGDKCNFASTNAALTMLLLPVTLVVFLTK